MAPDISGLAVLLVPIFAIGPLVFAIVVGVSIIQINRTTKEMLKILKERR